MREATCVSSLNNGFTKFYMEIAEKDKPLPVLKNDQMLVFVKYFDVKQQKLRYRKKGGGGRIVKILLLIIFDTEVLVTYLSLLVIRLAVFYPYWLKKQACLRALQFSFTRRSDLHQLTL